METVIRTCFIEATKNILQEIGFTDFSVGESDNGAGEEIRMLAAVGLVGDIKGHFVMKIGDGSISTLVRSISGHLELHDEDPNDPHYRKSLLGEIANQIGGRASSLLSKKGIECMITPPTVIVGDGIQTALPESDERLSFPAVGSFGRFGCVIALKKIKSI